MKKNSVNIIILTLLAVLVSLQSCKKDPIIDLNENNYSFETDVFFTTLSSASIIAENIDKSSIVTNGLKTTKSQKRKIKSQLTIHDISGQVPYFYVFNYETGGYAIVSADQRLSPIIGYCENGEFVQDAIPPGMVQWLECTAAIEKDIRAANNKPSKIIGGEWDILLDRSSLKNAPIDDNPHDYYVTVGPFLKTKWDQKTGYNTYCPVLSGGPNGHAYTGCGTTAVAQVMNYWKYPAGYNWSAMSTYASDAVARLMSDIFPHVIDSYDTGGSSCKNDWNIVHTFQNFNYKSVDLKGYVNGWTENGGYNYQTVKANLDQHQPVILGAFSSYKKILGVSFPDGSGHLWVCDGYKKMSIDGNGYLLFYMNWGWGGSYNGWYAYNNWSSSGGSYNYFPDMIYNIHP